MSPLSKQSIHLRPLALGDAGWIIHRHAVAIAPEFGWGLDFEALCAQVMADYLKSSETPGQASWVATHDNTILGSLLLMRENATTARLRLLYVEPQARGLGLATRLLNAALTFAREAGYSRVILFTTGSNLGARRIYEALGMRVVHEELLHFSGKQEMGETWEILL